MLDRCIRNVNVMPWSGQLDRRNKCRGARKGRDGLAYIAIRLHLARDF